MRLATWNIQGLRTKQTEVFKELDKAKIDICVLTETKKKGKGVEEINDYIHIYSGVSRDSRAKRGVSIAIRKNLRDNIKKWEEIDEQMITLELRKNGHNIVIIGIYAPSDDADQQIKNEFYNKLADTIMNTKKHKELYILGDLNGRTGTKQQDVVIGKHGERTVNDNGERLRNLCQSLKLKIMNGFFPHRDIHKFTWTQPTRGLRSIIDYFIQRQNATLQTTDVRVYRGSECGSDHHLVVGKIIVNYKYVNEKKSADKENKKNPIDMRKYNIESLKHDSTKFLYKIRLASKLQRIQEKNKSANEIYEQVKTTIHGAAKEALGYIERGKKTQKPEWWSEELKELVENKKRAYQKWLQTQDEQDRLIYSNLNRVVKKEVVKKKNEMWERKCEEVDRYIGGTKTAEAWKVIRNLRKNEKETYKMNLINTKEWESHYKALLTENRPEFKQYNVNCQETTVEEVEQITVEEIKETLKRTKNRKAAGPGDIPIELVKYGTDRLLEIIAEIYNKCLIEGHDIPEDWNLAHINSIHKKGDKKICENYRGISVTSSVGRLYGGIIKQRIEKQYEDIEEQCGFRGGRSCTDNIFVLRQIIEKRKNHNLSTHLIFIDLEKAYDTVPLKKLFEVLQTIDLSKVYIRAIINIYKNMRSAIKQGKNISEPFSVTKGLRQGCCLSPTLFKIYISKVLEHWRRTVSGMGIDIDDSCLTTLLFADDQIIIANDENDADYMFRKLQAEYKKWGLNINMTKTEYLKIGDDQEDPELEIRNLKRTSEFKYLGSIISEEGTSRRDIQGRLQQGQKTISLLNPLLWSSKIKLKTKITIYRVIVETIMTYGSECWQLTAKDKNNIGTTEMDFLRRACRVSRMEHVRNEEIRRRTRQVYSTVDRVETKQLIWYGHVMRMTETRWPKKALNYKPQNRRKRGRPATSWQEGI